MGESRRCAGWLRPLQPLASGAGLLLAEVVLVGESGTPAKHLLTLRHVGDAWSDPVESLLALMALVAEALMAYLLVVLLLRSLALLPGAAGRTTARVTTLVTPVAVRRVLDLLLGGTLLAQATLGLVPSSPLDCGSRHGTTATVPLTPTGQSGRCQRNLIGLSALTTSRPVFADATARMEPVDTRPSSRRASASLPPWLGGGPSNAAVDEDAGTAGRSGTNGRRQATSQTGNADQPGTSDRPRTADEPGDGGQPGAAGRPRADGQRAGPPPGGGTTAGAGYTIRLGDTLWGIAASHLGPTDRSVANIHRYWQQLYRVNLRRIGPDPDLIHPGTRLVVPAYRRDDR